MQEMQETWIQPLGLEDPPEMDTAPTPVLLLESPMGRGAWRATVHRAAKSQTRLKQLSTHTQIVAPNFM